MQVPLCKPMRQSLGIWPFDERDRKRQPAWSEVGTGTDLDRALPG